MTKVEMGGGGWGLGTSTVCTIAGAGEEGANCAEPQETAQSSVSLPSPVSATSVNVLWGGVGKTQILERQSWV